MRTERLDSLEAAFVSDEEGDASPVFLLAEHAESSHERTQRLLREEEAAVAAVDARWTFVLGDAVGMTEAEQRRVLAAGGVPLSLGTQSLLADHCVSLVHYNLDQVLGCSPVR